MSKAKLNWILVLPLVVLVVIASGGCTLLERGAPAAPESKVGDTTPRGPSPVAPRVRVPAATPSSSSTESSSKVVLEMSGKVLFSRTERLYFEVPGTVERLLVEEGDRVRMGDRIAALDTSTVVSLQKQVAVARVSLDEAEKALKDERERYLSGDVQALQARVAQLQKDLYVLRQTLADTREAYLKKMEEKLGVSVPSTLSDRPPEQLAEALVAQLGVQVFWRAFQDHVRRLLEGPWEQLNQLRGETLQLQQTLRSQEQQLEDLVKEATLAKAQAEVQVARGKVETARLERAAALLRQRGAILQRESAVVRWDSALREYRDQVRDLLGFTVDRELGNGLYLHLPLGSDHPRTVLEQKLEEHVQALFGRRLQPELLKDADPESLVSALLARREGRDHVLDFFLQQKAAGFWLRLQQARREVARLTLARTQASERLNPSQRSTGDLEAAWADLLVADMQLKQATQRRDTARVVYKQLFQDYLNVNLDQYAQGIWEEEPPEGLLRRLLNLDQVSLSIPERLRQDLTEALQTAWSKVHQADLERQEAALGVQQAEVAILESDIAVREAEEALRQAKNTLDDIASKATYTRLEVQKEATLSRLRQVQDQLKDAEDRYKDGVENYLGVRLSGLQANQGPYVLLRSVPSADTPGFRRFERDVVLLAQGIWGQLQRTLEELGKAERALKKAREDLADALEGPDPLLVARREQEVALALKNLEDLERKLSAAVLRAPFNGVIRRVMLDRGDPVQAYQTVAEILDLSSLEIEIIADELDVAHLVPGTAVQVRMEAFLSQVSPGRLVSVNPVPKTLGTAVQYQAKVRMDSEPTVSLYEGMSARVRIEVPQMSRDPAR